mmetsp:Transcript_23578/g.30074  ORF Transcript_23578/g.30074 Transcript_23578/m.30074 type:complete len:133 (-) Transcript_23578:1213-1611(-)
MNLKALAVARTVIEVGDLIALDDSFLGVDDIKSDDDSTLGRSMCLSMFSGTMTPASLQEKEKDSIFPISIERFFTIHTTTFSTLTQNRQLSKAFKTHSCPCSRVFSFLFILEDLEFSSAIGFADDLGRGASW